MTTYFENENAWVGNFTNFVLKATIVILCMTMGWQWISKPSNPANVPATVLTAAITSLAIGVILMCKDSKKHWWFTITGLALWVWIYWYIFTQAG